MPESVATISTTLELSPTQARKIVLLSQGMHKQNDFGRGTNATLRVIEKLSYIQIDTISVVQRAHHHTLWNRANNYQLEQLDVLQKQHKIFEYWSHAAAYLPMRDFRYSLPRKQAITSGEIHWYEPDAKLNRQVLRRIAAEGPLQARDFKHIKKSRNQGWWEWKPAKRALEQLFMQGDLMITKRQGFQKVYDLTERVIPNDIDQSMPSANEYHRHLIKRYITANGLGRAAEIAYLRKGLRAKIETACQQMSEQGELFVVTVNDQQYYALADVDKLLSKSLSRNKVKILSPFDNLLIQRNRMRELFGFDYQIECYLPAAQRQHGYFCLPLLWGQGFAGRMDAKIDRKTGILHLVNLHIETRKSDEFIQALKPSLDDFLNFNQGNTIIVQRITGHNHISQSSKDEFKRRLQQ